MSKSIAWIVLMGLAILVFAFACMVYSYQTENGVSHAGFWRAIVVIVLVAAGLIWVRKEEIAEQEFESFFNFEPKRNAAGAVGTVQKRQVERILREIENGTSDIIQSEYPRALALAKRFRYADKES